MPTPFSAPGSPSLSESCRRPRSHGAQASFRCALLALLLAPPVQAGDLIVTVRDPSGTPLADVVVEARGPGNTGKAPAAGKAVVDQIGKEFVPWVSVIPVGSAVTFPNQDDIRHHVYSFSPAKQFELPLYKGTPAGPVVFDQAGIVALGCNIHDWMLGYVVVSDAAATAVTDDKGTATFSGLAAGGWTITTWHPAIKGGKVSPAVAVTVPATGQAASTANIAIDPTKKRRRAPRAGDRDY